jgi:hypothetical protein
MTLDTKTPITLYHGSPNPDITTLRSGSYVTPHRYIAEIMGRYHEDTGETWKDDDVAGKGYSFTPTIRFKPGREPTGKPTIYSIMAANDQLDLLDNPHEHTTKQEFPVTKTAELQPKPQTAVIIRGNPDFITNNPAADLYYTKLQQYLEGNGYAVSQHDGAPHTVPLPASAWLGHSRGADRLRFAPEGTKTIALGAPGGINHPRDKAMLPGQVPTDAHYRLTPAMLRKLDAALQPPVDIKSAELQPWVQLQPHQQRVADRVSTDDPRMLVYHGLGTGKSLAAIAAAEAAKSQGGGEYGIVAPASLRDNFRKEVGKFTRGSQPEILSYTEKALGRKFKNTPGTLIFDEAHRLRNPESMSARASIEAAKNSPRVALLTGSPITNHPTDLAGPLSILKGQNISPEEFEKQFVQYKKVKPGWWPWLRGVQPGEEMDVKNPEQFKSVFRGHVDYNPGKSPEGVNVAEEVIDAPMTTEQERIQKAIRTKVPPRFLWKIDQEFPLSREELGKLNSFLTGMRQVSLSTQPFRADGNPLKAFGQSGKLQLAMEKLKGVLDSDERKKAIIYSNYIDAGLQPYAAALKQQNIPHAVFHGGVSLAERRKALDEYNAGKLRALLIGPAGAEGISTKGTSLIQLLDPHWNETRSQQAKGRGLRFDSHMGLPEELKDVAVQRFISRASEPGWLKRMLFKAKRQHTGDEILDRLSKDKEKGNDKFRKLLQEVGTESN